MASAHGYKRFENSIAHTVKRGFFAFFKAVGRAFLAIGRALTRRYTVVLVPHSEKKVYNLHISVLAVFLFFAIFASILGTFLYFGVSHRTARDDLVNVDGRLRDTQANLDQIRDELGHLFREVRTFEPALQSTLSTLGVDAGGTGRTAPSSRGDLASFFDIRESPTGILREVEDIRRLSDFLNAASGPIMEIGSLINSHNALLTEIPSIWPIQGGIGRITMYFGQNIHPFNNQFYIHRGIDISNFRQGDPIVATADGQVVLVGFDHAGFGNNVIIRHRHGFYTRYAHMLSFRVQVGQRVQQGDVIGHIGNTGMSTGPHLHYEVHIGSDVVDPYRYLNIRSTIARTTR